MGLWLSFPEEKLQSQLEFSTVSIVHSFNSSAKTRMAAIPSLIIGICAASRSTS